MLGSFGRGNVTVGPSQSLNITTYLCDAFVCLMDLVEAEQVSRAGAELEVETICIFIHLHSILTHFKLKNLTFTLKFLKQLYLFKIYFESCSEVFPQMFPIMFIT